MMHEDILEFFQSINKRWHLPKGVDLIYPFDQKDTLQSMQSFYTKYYADNKSRKLILGINPGRLGAGVTGVPFTDPVHLEEICKIKNDFKKKHELSSLYVFKLVDAFGGPKKFFKQFYISSVCPLGFTKGGINYNYYDDKELYAAVEKYIIKYIRAQLKMNIDTSQVFCWGKGKNYKFLSKLNDKHQWFGEVVPQPHPRWIMQYRRKTMDVHMATMIEQLIA